jgi:hypothetical protein
MAPSQAGLPVTLHGLGRGTPRGVQTPYVRQLMSLHRLLLALDATPSWEGPTPFSECNELCPPDPGAPFLVSQDIWPQLPPDCAAAVTCVSRNG